MAGEELPLEWRAVLAEVMADAERRGLGRMVVGFTAVPGMGVEAEEYIAARCAHLAAAAPTE
jgi:hypothetical protein